MEESRFLTNPGDSLIIETRQNDNGDYVITNPQFEFDGAISSESSVDIFFRTLSNGVMLSEWVKVGHQTTAIQQHTFQYSIEKGQVLQVKFERSDNEVQGAIEFVRFYVEGTCTLVGRETPTIDASMFAGVNSDPTITALENNLFKKLYFRGIVPNYIKRGENLSMAEDRDYVTLFSSIARFFAMIIKFFKRWENINNDEEMLKELLHNYGIQFNESNITLEELQRLTQNVYNEFAKRGTKEMILLKGDLRPDGTEVTEDGELIRLIRADETTELLIEDLPKTEMGWCLGKSSPIYTGVPNSCYDLIKMGVKSKLFASLAEFKSNFLWYGSPVLGTGRTGLTGYTIRLNDGCGIGRISTDTQADDSMIPVDTRMDYELVVGIRVKQSGVDGKIWAYVEGFNSDKIKLPDSFAVPDRSSVIMYARPGSEDIVCGNFFESEGDKNCPTSYFKTNVDYYIKFIIKSYSTQGSDNYALNIGLGNELMFNNAFLRYIVPTIAVESASVEIFDIHLRPLVRGTNINPKVGESINNCFSLGFLQTSKFFHTYLRNRNGAMSENDVKDFIDRYMMPYSGANLITFIK